MRKRLSEFLKRFSKESQNKEPIKEAKIEKKTLSTEKFPGIAPDNEKKVLKFLSTWQEVKMNLKKKSWLLIFMEMNNGDFIHFFVDASSSSFKSGNKCYIIDPMYKEYLASMKCYFLWYHEGFCLPIKRAGDLEDMKKIVADGKDKLKYTTNPELLENFMTSRIAEGIMKGQKIEEFLNVVKVMGIVVIVIQIIMFFLMIGVLAKLLTI